MSEASGERARQESDHVEAIEDPAERARAATELLGIHQSQVNRLAGVRRHAIAELRSAGLSYAQVADVLGVSRGRIAQLSTSPFIVEQEFFGGAHVTIATPLRAHQAGRPLVAQEDFEAATTLTRLLESAQIRTSLGQVQPDGGIDLSPPAHVIICGPKSSSVVRDLVAQDPVLAFAPDEAGRWRLVERATGREFPSPLDQAVPRREDVAYLARLTVPGEQRTVLVIAGVHAIGSFGVAAFLAEPTNLHRLHSQVGSRPFSAIISSSFEERALAVTWARVAFEPQLHT